MSEKNAVKKDERLADKIEREGIESFVTMWENIPLFETQKSLAQNVQEAVRKERLANNSNGLANSLRGMGTGLSLHGGMSCKT